MTRAWQGVGNWEVCSSKWPPRKRGVTGYKGTSGAKGESTTPDVP